MTIAARRRAIAHAKSFSGGARDLGISRLTDAGRELLELAGPAFAQTRTALAPVLPTSTS